MKKEENEYLSNFPENIINLLRDVYPKLLKSVTCKDIVEIRKYTIIFYQILLDMFKFAWNDDWLIMEVWMFGTWYFIEYDDQISNNLWLYELDKEISYLFTHELDLPPHHTGYWSYDEPKRLTIEKLQQAIIILG